MIDAKILVGIYVFFSLAVIIALIVMTKDCPMNSWNDENSDDGEDQEDFKKCICSGSMDKRDCQDTETIEKDYEDGTATEFSTFKPHGWTKTSPGDLDWPVSVGCPWPNEHKSRKWSFWDYTDFGK